MFNRFWVYLALVLLPLGLVAHVRALTAISALLLILMPAAWWWNRNSLRGVTYERRLGERRAFPGETIDLTLRVTNRKALPLAWLTVEDQWPLALPPVEGTLFPSVSGQMGYCPNAFSVRWFERVSRHYRLRCTRRGYYPFGPARLASGDIFGLFQQEGREERLDWLVVYPQVVPLEALGFPPKQPFGPARAAWRLFEDPSRALGIRDYQPEDGFRHIHWKATARRQDLQVKVYEPATSQTLVVALNVATMARYWQGTRPLLMEKTICVAASIVNHGVAQRWGVGLIANGAIPHSDQAIKVLPSRRPDQLARLLEALAAVTSFATSSIERLLLAETARLPWGATLVVVTAVVTEELVAALLRLADAGRRLALVSIEQEPLDVDLPPALARVTHHLAADGLPFDESLLAADETAGEWVANVAPPLRVAGGGA